MEDHIKNLEDKLDITLENMAIVQFELEDHKSENLEKIERLKQQIKG